MPANRQMTASARRIVNRRVTHKHNDVSDELSFIVLIVFIFGRDAKNSWYDRAIKTNRVVGSAQVDEAWDAAQRGGIGDQAAPHRVA